MNVGRNARKEWFDEEEDDGVDWELYGDVIPTSDLAPPPPLAPSNAASNSNPAPPAPTNPSTTTASSSSPAPSNTTNMSQNANTPLMPPRGHSTAQSFDPSEVRSLRRYFQDLEVLFTQCQITDDAAKKQWAVRYPSIDVADLWETIESFIDVAKSYNDWKADVRALYPGADDTRKWSLADMDQLIGERARIGIHNAADLGCYYRDFMAITKHLIAQHRLSTIEQSRAFLRGFQPALLTRLETRLHLKHPDHYADDPYTMAEIHAAATFILHGTSSTPTTAVNQATASTSNTSTTVPPGMIKTEDISMIIESLSRTIATLIQPTTHATHNHAPAPRQQAAVHIHENSGVEQTCHYCGNRGCRVGTCEFAEIDIRDGKCKRNTEGKIVLPNGSFCPRTIPGLTIRDRIYEWHRRNPAAPAAPTMLFEIDDRSTMQTFTLNTSSRIEALERELLQLRKRREVFDGVEILQRKKPTTTAVPKSAEASGSGTSKGVAAPPSTSTSTAPPPTIPAAAPAPPSPPTQSTSHPITTSAPPAPPVHPFANARDATYAPPNVRNFATPPKPSNDKGKEPAYKTIVPVVQPKLAEEIFQRSMKSQFVTLTPEELLSIAPDVRNKYRDAVTPKRVSTEPVASAHIVEIGADEVAAVNQLSCSGATLEPGATIVPDPYETYLKHIPHGEHPTEFTVARDSNAIRLIIALIDNKEQIECIVDPGSQIVTMSEEVCLGLNLLFDPTIQLNMQSANGEVDRSLGLIRNVPFRIGEIVLYLQAHVIRNAAYDILLGRPFDVLTQSVVKNFTDENQTITILCPNTGETVTIPTFEELIPHDQGEAALVIDYDGVNPSISFVAPIDSSTPNAVSSLYLSACTSVSSYLQSLYASDTTASNAAPSNTSTWASTLLFSALFASTPSAPPPTKSISQFSNSILPFPSTTSTSTPSTHKILAATKKKYKPVTLKTRPVLGAVPEQF
ncbi:hypothetical protein POSPLADRAFT_1057393 [Postia placenta MAD-698-R-SB12]|uniref:Uncharacterized protein n=1 Tax=Postia placenta MAD-698-R-SB12 TaxID=670580 RepID=A0A1X6MZF1_9APHY|nr:hypothetical protein POSPLADRAFT_1057393 [Postia placenta MAD-698-R-SB12]OSX61622.1 hypothetical protein POSPLADRAFT_1057393 [Postia placenta MAD-698-R-SB12]